MHDGDGCYEALPESRSIIYEDHPVAGHVTNFANKDRYKYEETIQRLKENGVTEFTIETDAVNHKGVPLSGHGWVRRNLKSDSDVRNGTFWDMWFTLKAERSDW